MPGLSEGTGHISMSCYDSSRS